MLPEGMKFKLVWSDEFEGTALDASKWSYRTNFWGKRASWFAAPEDGAVTVKDGCAHLRIVKRADGSYCSPQLQTGGLLWDELDPKTGNGVVWPFRPRSAPKFLHRYGYYECRAKAMKACVCNAFWLYDPLSDSEAKFRSGEFSDEIDVFEVFGAVGKDESLSLPCQRICHQTVHCLGTPYLEATCYGSVVTLPERTKSVPVPFDFWADYHIYGFLWTETDLVWFVDGKETFRRANDRFKRPMHVTFDCEIMFDWAGEPLAADLPSVYCVDYFRYWKPAEL